MKARLILLLATVFQITACTNIEVENPSLPNLDTVTPQNIVTELPVYNIAVDDSAFDRMLQGAGYTIYVRGLLNYRNAGGQQIFNDLPMQMEVKGQSSAFKKMKSLGLIFPEPLDNSMYKLITPAKVINHHSLDKFYAIRFRNSGNDFGRTMLKDVAYTRLAIEAELDFELMYYQPVHVFINDNYYGLENLRTENNRKGMAGLRNEIPENITVIQIDKDNGNLEWDEGPRAPASQFETALEKEDKEQLWEMIDESSFIDYLIFQDYIGNHDWPHNNSRMYCINGGKFRFILYDQDFAAFNAKNPQLPELEYLDDDLSKLYRQMRKKHGFDARLKARQKELYKRFSPSLFESIVQQNAKIIEKEIPYFIARYGEPQSMFHWRMELDLLLREFNARDKYIREKYDL